MLKISATIIGGMAVGASAFLALSGGPVTAQSNSPTYSNALSQCFNKISVCTKECKNISADEAAKRLLSAVGGRQYYSNFNLGDCNADCNADYADCKDVAKEQEETRQSAASKLAVRTAEANADAALRTKVYGINPDVVLACNGSEGILQVQIWRNVGVANISGQMTSFNTNSATIDAGRHPIWYSFNRIDGRLVRTYASDYRPAERTEYSCQPASAQTMKY